MTRSATSWRTAGKEFTYTVSEVIPTDKAGVTYDESVYTVTVKVTDNGNGTLGTEVSYQKGEEKVNGISFANTYAAAGSVSLEASKTLNGAAPAAGKFSFELKDKDRKVLQTKKNDGEGKVTFDPISYKLEDAGKEFTYTVSEVILRTKLV
ncbi:MAG: FctA domain-containing protein [Lachnospiraceae bacterium]